MHKPPFQLRTRLPARERLRLARMGSKKIQLLCFAMLCVTLLLYGLGEYFS